MPNHVQNEIRISCPKQAFEEIKNLMKTDESDFDFNQLIPMPDDIVRGNLSFEDREKSNGRNWYDWCIENWGTKWNAYEVEWDDDNLTVRFWTAWSSVQRIVAELSKSYPHFDMEYRWADEDTGRNVGLVWLTGGKVFSKFIPNSYSRDAYELAFDIWRETAEDLYLRYDEEKDTYVYDESLC